MSPSCPCLVSSPGRHAPPARFDCRRQLHVLPAREGNQSAGRAGMPSHRRPLQPAGRWAESFRCDAAYSAEVRRQQHEIFCRRDAACSACVRRARSVGGGARVPPALPPMPNEGSWRHSVMKESALQVVMHMGELLEMEQHCMGLQPSVLPEGAMATR